MAYGDMLRTTVLEAVNIMISILGKRPVNDIDTSGVSEAVMARDGLHEVSKSVQGAGWSFNTDEAYPLAPDENNIITIPPNALRVDPSDWYNTRYVERANKLYDRTSQSFTITVAVPCDVVWFLPFTDLPEAFRAYVAIRAARKFQERFQADEAMWKFSEEDERAAWSGIQRYEIKNANFSIFDNTYLNRGILRRA